MTDVLADVLDVARVRGALMATFDAAGPWAIDLPARTGASFHAVVAGSCWFSVAGDVPRRLTAGDLVLLPSGANHQLASDQGLRPRRFDDDLKRSLITPDGELVIDGPGARTRILCAGYDYDTEVAHPLLSLLPPVWHVATTQPAHGPRLRSVLDLLAYEARGGAESGADTAATRLLDVLFIHVMRAWLDDQPAHRAPSWLRALRDPVTTRALAVVHAAPATPWTLDTLAAEIHVSRATLARRFTRHVGEGPVSYLTRWRMELAARSLRETQLPLATIAHDVGYRSEYAFNRAFTRHRGSSPGRYRQGVQPQL